MTDFTNIEKNLIRRGYSVKIVANAAEAADYLDGVLNDTTVGIGGSATVKATGLYERLGAHNTVYWHWEQDMDMARKAAMQTAVYLTSVNAIAETGEIVNIDGVGNRVASMLFGHQKVYYLVGRNKIAATYEDAVWRARNVAAPHRAQQQNKKTPCAIKAERCYDCMSPERICGSMVTQWKPMAGCAAEIILIDEELGL